MSAKLIDFVAPMDVIFFLGVPLVVMICVLVQVREPQRRRRLNRQWRLT